MKKLGILVLVLTGALGVAVWWTSLRAQQETRRIVAMLDEQPEIRVLESDYTPGWLSSEAMISFELRGAAGAGFRSGLEALDHPEARPRIGLRSFHTIEHGLLPLIRWLEAGAEGTPVVAQVSSRVDLDQETRLELRDALGSLPEMQARLVVRASGVVEVRFDMPVADLRPRPDPEDPSSVVGRFGGLHGSAVLSTAEGSAAGSMVLPILAVSEDAFEIDVSGIEVLFDGARHPSGVWVGTLSHEVASASFIHRDLSDLEPEIPEETDEDGAPVRSMGPAVPASLAPPDLLLSAEGVVLKADSRVSGAFLSGDLVFEAAELVTGTGESSTRAFQALSGTLAVESVNAETLGGLWLSDEASVSGPLDWIQRLAPGTPLLRLASLSARTPDGSLEASGEVRVPAAAARILAAGATLDQVLTGKISIEGPTAMLADPARPGSQRVVSLEEDGWIRVRGPRFQLDLVITDGVLSSHGKSIAWPGREPEEVAADRRKR